MSNTHFNNMKNIILALISAVLFSISWPTYGIPFFIFFALVPLLIAEHNISKFSKIERKAWAVFGLAYLTFMIWNIITTGWLYGSKNPDGTNSIPAVVLPVFANSLLYALVFLAYHWYKRLQGTYWGLTFLVVFWMGFEKFHLSWEFTWPWLNLGNVFADYPKLIQWYDTLGATGGSFWILLINIFAFYTIRIWEAGRDRSALIKNLSILFSGIFVPILISVIKYNSVNEKPIGQINVLLLQPDLDPYSDKYSKDSIQITTELLALAEEFTPKNGNQIDYYIGPETSIPGSGSISETGFEKSLLLNQVKDFLKTKPNSVFSTGISSHRFFYDETKISKSAYSVSEGVWAESYNSAVQLIPNQKVEVYHKGKLVPGVEIFPYINILKPILGNAMLDFGGTIASLSIDEQRKVFKNSFNEGVLAPVICYESIYGEFTTEYVKNGANFLAIMTNDSWWGKTEGHRQLLSYAKLRAIETRREIVRSANSGISAHINAKGDILESTLYDDRTTLFAKVNLYEGQTFYVRTGDLISRICIFILGFLLFYPLVNWAKNKIWHNLKI